MARKASKGGAAGGAKRDGGKGAAGALDFRGELAGVMFGFGDQREQLPEALELMNKIVLEYMEGMTKVAMRNCFNGKLTPASLQFAIRRDHRKVDRVKQLLSMYKKVVQERNLHLKDDAHNKATHSAASNKASSASQSNKRKAKDQAASTSKTKKSKRTGGSSGKSKKSAPTAQSKVSKTVAALVDNIGENMGALLKTSATPTVPKVDQEVE